MDSTSDKVDCVSNSREISSRVFFARSSTGIEANAGREGRERGRQSVLCDGKALLGQLLVIGHPFVQVQQIFRSSNVGVRSPRGCLAQLPGAFSDAEVERLVTALLLHEILRVLFARVISIQVVGRKVVQSQGAVVAFAYAEPVVPQTLADAEGEWPSSLRIGIVPARGNHNCVLHNSRRTICRIVLRNTK